MQNKDRITKFSTGRAVNVQFISILSKPILKHASINFIIKLSASNKTINFFYFICHIMIISRNFAECKQYLKKKSIKSEKIDEHMG